LPFGVVDIALAEGDGLADAAGGVEADGEEGAVTGRVDGEALIEEKLDFVGGEDFGLSVAIYFHGDPCSTFVFIERLFGGRGQWGGSESRHWPTGFPTVGMKNLGLNFPLLMGILWYKIDNEVR
jgi:hypothetical protein